MDTARITTSFIRKGTFPVMAGNPPADAAQPSGMNGIMVTVPIMEKHEPMAPRTPAFLFQNPQNKSTAITHSETPKNQLAPRMPKTGYIHEISGPLLMKGTSVSASYSNHFWYPKSTKMSTMDARTRW